MNVRVHIEQLVLEGIPLGYHQTALLQATVEVELSRLLTAGRLARHMLAGGLVPVISGGTIQLPHRGARHLGRDIAGAVYRGIGR